MNESAAERFQKKRVAIHEAGHTVMHLLVGQSFEKVTLAKDKISISGIGDGEKVDATATTGGGVYVEDQKTIEAQDKEVLSGILNIKDGLVSMAGPVAEALFVGKIDNETEAASAYDLGRIKMCCRAAINNGISDFGKWKGMYEMETAMVNAFSLGAQELLKKHWNCVNAISDTLIERETLSYVEVLEIARANGFKR
jgi:hypothetical protein